MKKGFLAAITMTGLLAVMIIPGVINAGGSRCGPFGPPPLPPVFAEKYDADNDGRLSPAEDKAARDAFIKQYDADRDGRLSCEEMEKAREDMHRALFEKIDADHDEVLSWDEFISSMEDFPAGSGPFPGPRGGPGRDKGQTPCD